MPRAPETRNPKLRRNQKMPDTFLMQVTYKDSANNFFVVGTDKVPIVGTRAQINRLIRRCSRPGGELRAVRASLPSLQHV